MPCDPTFSSASRFFGIAEALCWAVGKAIRPGFIPAAMAMLVMRRVQRVRQALLVLEARFLAGRVRRRVSRGVAVEVEGVEAVPPRRRAVAALLPRRFAWLLPLVPCDAANLAGQLRGVLAEPGMQALLAACPQAVRVLGPLCNMLGIERAAFVPEGISVVRPRVARVRGAKLRPKPVQAALIDPELEDAHYAFSGVPRRFRLQPRPG